MNSGSIVDEKKIRTRILGEKGVGGCGWRKVGSISRGFEGRAE